MGTLVAEKIQAAAQNHHAYGAWHFGCGAMLTGARETQTMIEIAVPTPAQRPWT